MAEHEVDAPRAGQDGKAAPREQSSARLLALLESADRGSRDLDAEIVVALDLRPDWSRGYAGPLWIDRDAVLQPTIRINTVGRASRGNPPIGDYPHFTKSLDDALSLVPEDFAWSVQSSRQFPGQAWLYPPNNVADIDFRGEAATAPLALCLASLRARQAKP